MNVVIIDTDFSHLYDLCAKYLARDNVDHRHSFFGHLDESDRGRFSEGWRFPWVESHRIQNNDLSLLDWNAVTFLYRVEDLSNVPTSVHVVGSFSAFFEPIELKRVEQSRYWSISLQLPACRVFQYVFLVDGQPELDPINPRIRVDLHGDSWSVFWTDYCQEPVTFELWEAILLQRLTDHILPFTTQEARIFLARLDPSKLGGSRDNLFRFDQSVGVVNYLDKLLAGAELHQRYAYKTCLYEINKVLRARNPYQEPRDMAESFYVQLYNDLANDNVPGWDRTVYNSPSYFLKLLRRHVIMGAFSHPKYGGNVGAFAWDYLAERFTDPDGNNVFEWRQALEAPWGTNEAFRG